MEDSLLTRVLFTSDSSEFAWFCGFQKKLCVYEELGIREIISINTNCMLISDQVSFSQSYCVRYTLNQDHKVCMVDFNLM